MWRWSTSLLLQVPSSFPGCHWPSQPASYNHWSMGPQIALETPISMLSMMICIPMVQLLAWLHTTPKPCFLGRPVGNSIGGSLSSGPLVAGLSGCCSLLLLFLTGAMALGPVQAALWAFLISPLKCGRASGPPLSIVSLQLEGAQDSTPHPAASLQHRLCLCASNHCLSSYRQLLDWSIGLLIHTGPPLSHHVHQTT